MTAKVLLISVLIGCFTGLQAQDDTVTLPVENLPPLYIWKNKKDYKNFRRMVYNLKKVYPYAQVAKNKLINLNRQYSVAKTKKERKEAVKKLEKELFAEFDAPLRKLTRSQGKMLIKLIDRETGESTYSVLKEFKGGFNAFLWQGVATLFGHNLKARYNKNGDDKILEELVQMCENGTFNQLYYSMFRQ
jgi:hypothetical protein